MLDMAERKKPKAKADSDAKRYPSRDGIKYVAVPLALYELLEKYAEDKSDEDDKKSIAWAARVAIRKGLAELGYTAE